MTLSLNMRVEWTERGSGGSIFSTTKRGAVERLTDKTAWVFPDSGIGHRREIVGLVHGKHDKFRPLTAAELAIEAWLARKPRSQWVDVEFSGRNSATGDVRIRVTFYAAPSTDKGDHLERLAEDVLQTRAWLAERPAP